MTTKAHRDSRKFVLDPFWSAEGKNPPDPTLPGAPSWLYGPYEYEAFVLERMFREKNEAKLKVGYTNCRRKPAPEAFFSAQVRAGERVAFRASGEAEAFLDGEKIGAWPDDDGQKSLPIPRSGHLVLHLHCGDVTKAVPALLVEAGPTAWLYSPDGEAQVSPVPRPRNTAGLPPHAFTPAAPPLELRRLEPGVWDGGRELFGRVEIRCGKSETPDLFVGESRAEMDNTSPEDEEQTRELISAGPGVWYSKVPLAFRYLRLSGAERPEVRLHPLVRPAVYRGAFAVPGDEELTRIWMHSAYTLRLCMVNFFVDGVKRDRLPWAGDLAVSLLGNAFSFGDGGILRDSLSVLGATGIRQSHVNGIADFSLWYLINHELYQRYFGDPAFLEREYPRITETLEILLSLRDEKGFLLKRPDDWFFIDWAPGDKMTAVQILFVRALRAGAALAERMQEPSRAASLRETAAELAGTLRHLCFDAGRGLFVSAPGSKEFTRHPDLLAVLAGITSPEESRRIGRILAEKELPPVGTPYMSALEVLAMEKAGEKAAALAKLREIWGGMLSCGATTFWEAFDPAEPEAAHPAFYGRPFGRSLCHAWGTGPLFLLPRLLFGAEPLADGWSEFRFDPAPGVTGSVAIPVPGGVIEAEVEAGRVVKLEAPPRCRLAGR